MDPVIPARADFGAPGTAGPASRSARSVARSIARSVRENNPFYLLSAACMLGGCLLLTNSLSWSPIGFTRLVMLLAAINVYEVMLLGLGLYLVARRGNARDGGQLLVLAAIFMADAAFLVSEVVSSSLGVGAAVSAVLFLAAVGKVAVAGRMLRVRFDGRRWAAACGMLWALFAFPVWLKWVGDTRVTGAHLYFGWWVAAVLWALWDVASRRKLEQAASLAPVRLEALFVVVPWVSLLTHLGIMHYVYNQPFIAADAAPGLLALTLVMLRVPVPAVGELARLRRALMWALPAAAVMASARPQVVLTVVLGHVASITPWMLALAGAYLTMVWSHWPRYMAQAVMGGAVGLAAYTFGPSAAQVGAALSSVWAAVWGGVSQGASTTWDGAGALAGWLWGLLPKTAAQWGLGAVAGAFVLLGFGARVSFKTPPAPKAEVARVE